ncbi:hypothetical protein AeMF1_021679 [Aphanomyces euteiches]|nr:hypothetical protein AeMF1_021679 [Aphanomyces euteiches]KAH9186322.1 hypothetical protein AeNC1_011703 [Aphanomyces euteiches]
MDLVSVWEDHPRSPIPIRMSPRQRAESNSFYNNKPLEDPTSNRRDVDDQLPNDAPIRDNLVPRIANENDDDDILDDIPEPPNENETGDDDILHGVGDRIAGARWSQNGREIAVQEGNSTKWISDEEARRLLPLQHKAFERSRRAFRHKRRAYVLQDLNVQQN